MADLIHPKLFDNLHNFFNRSVTVQSQSQTVSSFGEVSSTWSNRTSLEGVQARISGLSDKQIEQAKLSGYVVTHQVLIPQYSTALGLSDRIVVLGDPTTSISYEVRQVDYDSEQKMTKVLVRRVDSPST